MQLDLKEVERIVDTSLAEDIGKGDVTSNCVIPEDVMTSLSFVGREDMVVCGIAVVEMIFNKTSQDITIAGSIKDGDTVSANTIIMEVSGNARAILKAERVALNMIQHLSGIATLTASYVKEVAGTKVKVLDTRKTLPGLRELEKYAVRTGGGTNHRMRLDDGILIKDNHISIHGNLAEAVQLAKKEPHGMKVEVECDSIDQVKEAISAGADIILLDNMDIKTLKEAVKLTDGRAKLEASGGIRLNTIRAVAETGVDFISVGQLTCSAPSVDIGLDFFAHENSKRHAV